MRFSPPLTSLSLPAFIVLDGVNGAGKSTLMRGLSALFEKHGAPLVTSREPGATELGKKIRALALGQHERKMNERAELLLFAADRAEHVAQVIRPALAAGKSVLCDRYYYSTVAFQGYGRQLDLQMINMINAVAINGLLPTLTIFLDLPPEEGLRRIRADSGRTDSDSFEAEEIQFHQRLRQGYLNCAAEVSEPCAVIDASKTPAEILAQSTELLSPLFKSR